MKKRLLKKMLVIILLMLGIILGNINYKNAIQIASENNSKISYQTHVQDEGWQNWKNDGQLSGTEGKSLRLEGIKIKLNKDLGFKIKYKTHVENIGWQNWKYDGNFSGTQGQSLRLEGIRIQLEDTDKYSVKYRVHVENIGWQDWKYDGELAGTEGQSLRLEAIEIKIVDKVVRGKLNIESSISNTYYDKEKINVTGWKIATVKNSKFKATIDNEKIADENIQYNSRTDVINNNLGYGTIKENPTPGFNFQINTDNLKDGEHVLKIELFTSDDKLLQTYTKKIVIDRKMQIQYSTHVEDIGWQSTKKDGQMAGTSGKSLRLESIKIKGVNLPEGMSIKYQTHVQDIGWQGWKNNGELSGTEGKSLRLEGIKILPVNSDKYSIRYRVHIENIGWQEWKTDGDLAGTEGKSLRLEAIEIEIIEKVAKGKMNIDTYIPEIYYQNEQTKISGWKLSNIFNSILKVTIDDKEIENINYTKRADVIKSIINYGSAEENPTPGFNFQINTDNLKDGEHVLKIEFVTPEGKILDSYNKKIVIDRNVHIKYQTHVENIGWQNYKMNGETAGTTGKCLGIEAIKISTLNLPEGMNIKYKAHVGGIGWQNWKSEGELAGTTYQSTSIEGIRIKLEGTEEYSITYRAHVENVGWQSWCYDGETSGTVGESKKIEAIQIKIVPKISKTKVKIGIDNPNSQVTNTYQNITGWVMSSVKNVSLKIFIDDKGLSTSQLKREQRQDVLNSQKGYGDENIYNPTPGFCLGIDFSKYNLGIHKIKVEATTEDGQKTELEKTFKIVPKITYGTGTYGSTGLKVAGDGRGSNLTYYRFGDGPNVFFATFCVHGFEDSWDRDGQVLVNIANDFYNRLVSELDYSIAQKWTIYIFPEVNPDGVRYGTTNYGPGRTTLHSMVGRGIDINRSWQTGNTYERNTTDRGYNGTAGFQAYEAAYLRDFILSHKSTAGQTVLVDLHGWEDQLIGNPQICSYYKQQYPSCSTRNYGSYGKQYIVTWANNQGFKSSLVELPLARNQAEVNSMQLSNKYINATLNMLRGI